MQTYAQETSIQERSLAGFDKHQIRERLTAPSVKSGALYGSLGAGLLAGIMYSLWAANQGPKPLFLDAQQRQFGEHGSIDHVAGALRFLAAGALWGAAFGAIAKKPDAIKGAAYGLLPSLFVWLVLAPLKGEKPFFGGSPKKIFMPLLFNSGIWGSFLGKSLQRG